MEKTTRYLGIREVEYKFSERDIREALMKAYKIKINYKEGRIKSFEIYDGVAHLIVSYEKEEGTNTHKEGTDE